jgi:WD40 repeat protein/serine/threonine protein kinase
MEIPMAGESESALPREQRLTQVVAAYMLATQTGRAPTRRELIEQHPDLADELEEFFRESDATKPLSNDSAAAEARAVLIKCPHCESRIESAEPHPAEMTCRNCGSTFQVTPDVTVTFRGGQAPKTIGKFQVVKLVGHGAFGSVYKARDAELDRTVAIKVPRAGTFASHEEEERFLREARSAAQLKHPSIVQVHEIARDGGVPYIVTDFIDGPTLADLITGRRPSFREAAELVAKIADALDYAHSMGVIHRDIKPANILLQRGSRELAVGSRGKRQTSSASETRLPTANSLLPFLTDFGLARRDEGDVSVTIDGQVLGTPAYMSPEQASGEGRVDARGDIYSLGVVLYVLLAAELPFRGNTRMLLHQVLHDEPRGPRSLNDTVPRDLETICLKAMAKSADRRYATAREFGDDLRRWLNGEPIRARPVAPSERLWRWARRKPLVAGLSAAVIVLLLGVSVVSVTAFVLTRNALHSETQAKSEANQHAAAKADLAEKEKDARQKTQLALQDSRHQLALNYVQRGVALAESGKASTGMAWLLRGLETADANDRLRSGILNLMAGWSESAGICLPHDAAVTDATFSPDGRFAVTSSEDKTCRLWDAVTGEPIAVPLRHDGAVRAVVVCPDGKTILSGSIDKTARLWNTATGEPIGEPMQHDGPVVAVAFSADGQTVLTGSSDKTARLWSAATGEPRGTPLRHDGAIVAVAFSPTGTVAITGSADRTARLWDATTGEPRGEPLRHDGSVVAVSFSPDGRQVLTGSDDRTARLWNKVTGEPVGAPLSHEDRVVAAAFSPDGETIVTGSYDKTARLWNATTAELIGTPLRHKGPVFVVGFSPDGQTVLTGGWDNAARLWDVTTGEPRGEPLRHGDWLRAAVFSPDGKTILTASLDNTARLWHTASTNPRGTILRHDDWVYAVAFSPDGKTVLTASMDKTARLWDAATGESIGSPLYHDDRILAAAFSPDGRSILTGDADRTASLWDLNSDKPRLSLRHDGQVHAVAFSPDGHTLLTASSDKTARLWDATSGEPRGTPLRHDGVVFAAAFSPDGETILTGSNDETAQLWNAKTCERLGPPLRHEDRVFSVSFSSDGQTILTGSADRTARQWSAATGAPIGTPLRHDDWVRAVAFSPDGRTILTGCLDNTARLWDSTTSEPRSLPLRHAGQVVSVAFSPDGRTILTGSADKTARLSPIPLALPDDPARIRSRVEVQTGQSWDRNGVLNPLRFDDWFDRRAQLDTFSAGPN